MVIFFAELPNLNPPIFLQWQFGPQLPNLIPANISVYIWYVHIPEKQHPASSSANHDWEYVVINSKTITVIKF